MAGESVPRLSQAGIDWRVLAFSIATAVLTSVLFGIAPAFQAAGADPAGELKEGARSIARGHDRFRGALVVVQITLGLVLLISAELLMAGFLHLVQRDPGFRVDHLLTFDVGLPEAQYDVDRRIAFSGRLLEQLRAIPGVQAAAAGTPLPLQGHQMRVAFDIEARPMDAPDRPRSDMAIVTPGYFGAMGIPLLKGRDFSERDDSGAPPVLVVNQAFARKFFPRGDAIGSRIQPGAGRSPVMREIVGVVGDAQQSELGTEADPIYYFAYKQLPWGIGTIVLRTAVPPMEVESAARAALESLDRQVPMHQIRTGEGLSATVIARMRFLIALMGGFALVALLLMGAGLYGVLSYVVARRRGEIGVRVALGAGRKQVLGMVFRQAMLLVVAGLVFGLAGAAVVGRLLATAIHGIRAGDPVILLGACAILVLTAFAAAYVPAMRAASVDPMQALRSE
jgi:putative ABC transport system permease protein